MPCGAAGAVARPDALELMMRRTQCQIRRAAADPGPARRRGRTVVATLAALLAAAAASAAPPAVDFVFGDDEARADRTLSGSAKEGHVGLAFAVAGDRPDDAPAVVFQLQRATDPSFDGAVVHHESAATAAFVSGLGDGTHHFRVRGRDLLDGEDALTAGRAGRDGEAAETADAELDWGPWSEPATFEVAHHAMSTAWTLLGIGAVLFASLVFIVLREIGDPRRGLGGGDGGRSGDDDGRAPEAARV